MLKEKPGDGDERERQLCELGPLEAQLQFCLPGVRIALKTAANPQPGGPPVGGVRSSDPLPEQLPAPLPDTPGLFLYRSLSHA